MAAHCAVHAAIDNRTHRQYGTSCLPGAFRHPALSDTRDQGSIVAATPSLVNRRRWSWKRQRTVMIEVKRKLYMDEATGKRRERFAAIREAVDRMLTAAAKCGI